MHRYMSVARLPVALGILVTMAACGGGGGGGGGGNPPAPPAPPPPTFTVGGTASGVTGSGLVLQLNGGNNLAIASNGNFAFPTQLVSGSSYSVTAAAQPLSPSQTCSVANGTGMLAANVSNIAVSCVTNSFNVAVTVGGLSGSGLVLINNGGDNLTLNNNGGAQFATTIRSGNSYDVRVLTQPVDPPQTCTVASGTGTIANASVNTTTVSCVTPVARFAASLDFNDSSYSTYVVDSVSGQLRPRGFGRTGRNPVSVTADSSGRVALVLSRGDGTLSSFVRDQVTGTLSEAPGSPYVTGADPTPAPSTSVTAGANTVTNHPKLGFVYIPTGSGTGPGANKITGFSINAVTGALSPIANSPFPAGMGPFHLSIDASGRFAYATNRLSDDINVYSIDQSSGALLENVASKVTLVPGASPGMLSLHPSGRFAYVTNTGTGTVAAFTVALDSGALTPVAGSPFAVGPSPALAPILHPSGRFLYVRSIATLDQPGAVSAFTIDQITGALAPIGSALPVGANSSAQAIDPAGRFLFVASRGALSGPPPVIGSIEVFRIGNNGALTALAGLPSLQPAPFSVSLDPSGRFVYSASVAGNVHRSYLLASDGALTPLGQGAQLMSRDQPVSLTVFPALTNPTAAASFTSKFAYVSNNGLDSISNLIFGFTLDPVSGALTATAPIPSAGLGAKALAVDPQSRFVLGTYESIAGGGGIATYGIIDANTGALGPTPLSNFSANISRVDAVAFVPNGTSAFLTSQLNELSPPLQSLSAVPVDPVRGTLLTTLILSNTFGPALDTAVAPNGRFAYFIRNDTSGFTPLDGIASPNSTFTVQPGISGKRAIVIEPTGRFAYVTIAGVENSIEIYSITPNGPAAGALNLLPGRVPTGGLLSNDVSADPTGRFLYTANSASGDLSMFSINPVNGGLTPLSPATISVLGNPRTLKTDYSGKFLYVLNNGSAKVQVYAINQSTGMLSPLPGEAGVGNLSFGLALSENVQ